MREIKVNLTDKSYSILIGQGLLNEAARLISKLNLGTDAVVITNTTISKLYLPSLLKVLSKSSIKVKSIIVADTEKSKSLSVAGKILEQISTFDKQRKIFIIALGGGVIGDLAGFVAGIYRRGICYIQIPTTLLAQVDSSIGGKTAVDLSKGKNLVGLFYQPKMVLTDPRVLKTLDLAQLRCGLAEVIKYGLIKETDIFYFVEENYKKILNYDQAALEFLVLQCSQIKAKIVSQDEREEKGLRTILNFGHTLGHAIEAAGKYTKYNHGQAVAIGMLVACDISMDFGLIDCSICQRLEGLIKKIGLPVLIEGITLNSIIELYYRDKKFIGARNRFVLLESIGKTKIVEDIPLGLIKTVLKRRIVNG